MWNSLPSSVVSCKTPFSGFVTKYVYETGNMTGIIGQLKLESFKKGERIIDIGLKGKIQDSYR